ncbi:MAG: ATP-binding protein [Desulfotignum sp.]|nr:ATP-binding protein [Desulfotignum sp.]
MERSASQHLDNWLVEKNRKPLVIRGARQVGKTWLVRDLATRHNLTLIELNFERNPSLADLFNTNDPRETLLNLESEFNTPIHPKTTLVFLDEIQAAPEIFAKLRWFKEDVEDLALIAAGSLLEFSLNTYQYSMPVGRISYFYLEPFSFFEFLQATGNDFLLKKLARFSMNDSIPLSLHEKALKLYHTYCLVGGMPEVLQKWADTGDLKACMKLQQDLLATFREDFYKYGDRFDPDLLFKLFISVCRQIGTKFVYSRVDPSAASPAVKNGLSLLCKARVFSQTRHTSANGLPLGAESNDKFFKILLTDTGLVSAQLDLTSIPYSQAKDIFFTNKGPLAEQFVGQQLRAVQSPLTDPSLFYWQRTGGRQGEIDYIIQHRNRIIPVEIKSGKAGSMKSLHQFMHDKGLDLALRINANLPAVEQISIKTTKGDPVSYALISIPLYLAQQIDALISSP